MSNFKTRLQNRDYPARIVEKHLSEIKSESMGAPGRPVLHAISPISMKLGQFKAVYPKTQNDKLVHSLDLYGGRFTGEKCLRMLY